MEHVFQALDVIIQLCASFSVTISVFFERAFIFLLFFGLDVVAVTHCCKLGAAA